MSKHKKNKNSELLNHHHCITCGTVISVDKQFCGEQCEEEFKKFSKRRKMQFIAVLALYGIMFLLFFILPPLLPRS
jgi:predicted nucleic acid-binding Zn ribbon protein